MDVQHFQHFQDVAWGALQDQRTAFNDFASQFEAWQVAIGSVLLYVVISWTWDLLFQEKSLFERAKLSVFRFARKIPFVRNIIKAKLKEPLLDIEKSMFKHTPKTLHKALPSKRMTSEQLLNLLSNEFQNCGDPLKRHQTGKVSGTIYIGGDQFQTITETLTKVYGMFAWTNPLHAGVFPGVRQLEAELVSMVCGLFHGGPDSCGAMTSGGTESIVIAMKAYRDWARDVKGITNPNIVAPRTGHPALDKACQFFNINLRKIPENPKTRRANVAAMRKAIDSNTIALFGSCPQYPHGCVDPIEDLAKLALKHNIGLHVDCCLGSFLVAYMRKAGFEFPAFDFAVPGVTSISCDTHKFGMSPKGSSIVMYSNSALRRYQYSVFPDWPGGIYGTPGVAGSRPGALIAATWSALMLQGEDGYTENCKTIVNITRQIARGIENIPGLRLEGTADVCIVAWNSDKFDINRMVDPMTKEKGWDLNVLQFPSCIHLCVTLAHTAPKVVETFLSDLREVTERIINNPQDKSTGSAAMYGMSQSIPDRTIIVDIVHGFLDTMYKTEASAEGKPKSE